MHKATSQAAVIKYPYLLKEELENGSCQLPGRKTKNVRIKSNRDLQI